MSRLLQLPSFHVRQLLALPEVQLVEAAAMPSPDTSVSCLHPPRLSVWRLLQLPSADTSVS